MSGAAVHIRLAGAFDVSLAREAVELARLFATAKVDGRTGPRHGSVFVGRGRTWLVYWTPNRRAVTVVERGGAHEEEG